jgi:hypothetical protein
MRYPGQIAWAESKLLVTRSLRRTNATLFYRRTGNLQPLLLLLLLLGDNRRPS